MEQYFEWDEAKNRKNQKKHDVSFETASLVFDDPLRISIQDRHTDGEERWQTIGKVKGVLMLLVAHTIFDEDDCEIIRIISARQVTKAERDRYEQFIYHVIIRFETALKVLSFIYFYRAQPQLRASIALYG